MKLPMNLTNLVPTKDRDEFKQQYLNSWYVRSILADYFQEQVDKLNESAESIDLLKRPNMISEYVSINAEKRGLRGVINLLREGVPDGWKETQG